MAVPWWVYLITLVMIGFGVVLHFLPVYLAKLEAQDKQRREQLKAEREKADGTMQ